jgi:hypothetical protein
MRAGAVACALGLAAPPAAWAQTAPLPSAEQILAKYESFLGGADVRREDKGF